MNFFFGRLFFFFLMKYGIITVARGAFSAYDPTISLLTMTLQTLLVYYSRRVSCLNLAGMSDISIAIPGREFKAPCHVSWGR